MNNKYIKITFLLIATFFANNVLAKNLRIVTTIKPVYFLVQSITKGVQNPILLINNNQSPHDYTLKPSDLRSIYYADVVFYISPNLEQKLVKAFNANIDKSKLVELISQDNLNLLTFDSEHHEHEHNIDPHIWLSPINAIKLTNIIAKKLSSLDPQNNETYEINAQKSKEKIINSIRDNQEKLKNNSSLSYITFHDSYRYFEDFFKIKPKAIINIGHQNLLSAKKVRSIRRTISKKNVKCIFTEPKFSSINFENFLVGQTKLLTLDPLGFYLDKEEHSYVDILNNLTKHMTLCK